MEKRVLMAAADIDLAVHRIGLQILEKHQTGSKLAIVGIHTCGVHVARRLHRIISDQVGGELPFGTLDINLYRDDWSLISQNPVVRMTDIPFDVDNADVVLVDDVIFTGRTIRAAMDAIMDYGRPNTIQLASLVDRGGRELPIQPDYVGLTIGLLDRGRINVVLSADDSGGEVVVED